MNAKLLLLALTVTAFSSCSTAYKTGQTPDDVYYSPIRPINEENEREERRQEEARRESPEDRDIRMGIRNSRWRTLNVDYGYGFNRYSPNCNCYCNNFGFGYYNHPYFVPSPYFTPISPIRSNPSAGPVRTIRLGGYGNGGNNNGAAVVNPKTGQPGMYIPQRQYNNSNNTTRRGNGLGNAIREILSPSSNSTRSSSSGSNNSTRSYQPSSGSGSSSSGSSSGSSGGGGGISRPARGGK
jgi:uncharacterized membrane protein YgcG